MAVTRSRSSKEPAGRHDAASSHLSKAFDTPSLVDPVAFAASVPLRGRLCQRSRKLVVTTRMGGTIVLQSIGFNQFAGVAAQLCQAPVEAAGMPVQSVRLVLRHADPAYCVELARDISLEDAVAEWRHWADRLSVPLLLQDETGQDSTVRAMLGAVALRAAQPRRARTLVGRRPRFSKRKNLCKLRR
jgi:hypothetical protein